MGVVPACRLGDREQGGEKNVRTRKKSPFLLPCSLQHLLQTKLNITPAGKGEMPRGVAPHYEPV